MPLNDFRLFIIDILLPDKPVLAQLRALNEHTHKRLILRNPIQTKVKRKDVVNQCSSLKERRGSLLFNVRLDQVSLDLCDKVL